MRLVELRQGLPGIASDDAREQPAYTAAVGQTEHPPNLGGTDRAFAMSNRLVEY